jgi:hypothetical protein
MVDDERHQVGKAIELVVRCLKTKADERPSAAVIVNLLQDGSTEAAVDGFAAASRKAGIIPISQNPICAVERATLIEVRPRARALCLSLLFSRHAALGLFFCASLFSLLSYMFDILSHLPILFLHVVLVSASGQVRFAAW